MALRRVNDAFSGARIHAGHGIRFVPNLASSTQPSLPFLSRKSLVLFRKKKQPRRIPWTVLYRKVHRKNVTEEEKRRRQRKVRKVQRPIVGADLEQIRQKKAQRPQIRAAAQEAAKKELEARKAKKEAAKAKAKQAGKPAFQQPKGAVAKHGAKGR
eukprot:NODE_7690_length_580_cov_12.249448_g7667_i0.p2 GENE.NODE_7690_length_580_cov_12.249448_g7667_i0~~NODE_7690_length_580_cov_12.249448_g7667_i0.p2  ORF type:complete len:156 (+),score=41.57 NODE_7690_length_580_cov_12.249448_g7667_i0:58-525(+)